tara:strand:- start:149 stop:730 length:582 start_codon:yes stop_codon:yes gene_type:complete
MIKKTFILLGSILFLASFLLLNSCGIYRPVSAKDYPPDPKLRVKKNIEEGRGFRLMGGKKRGGTFDFASSNELWRAALDTIDFMPLASANYSGGIIITDWYSDQTSSNESLKISIRFLTNEIRSDALDVKIFKKDCNANNECEMYEEKGDLIFEIKKSILKKAAIYEKENKKSGKSYRGTSFEGQGTDGPNIF